MTKDFIFSLTLISTLGSGLMAGVFFAFSVFVMKALARLSPAQGIAAMQSINIVVINPWFMSAFLGTAVACVILLISSAMMGRSPRAAYLFLGSLLYLFGTVLVTIAFNVPRNDALAAVDPTRTDSAPFWAYYVTSWTHWNHVRTAAALAASTLLTFALYVPSSHETP